MAYRIGGCECCDGDDPACCGDGTRAIDTFSSAAVAPDCTPITENDDYDLVNGTAGMSTNGTSVVITGTSESRQLGIDYSADLGDTGDFILGDPSGGPINIAFTPPEGKRVCAVRFGVAGEDFGDNTTWSGTVTDTGGNLTLTDLLVTTSAFNPCVVGGYAFIATAAAGESITSIEVSHAGDPDNYIAIGHIAICLADGAPDLGIVDHDGDYVVDHVGDTIAWGVF